MWLAFLIHLYEIGLFLGLKGQFYFPMYMNCAEQNSTFLRLLGAFQRYRYTFVLK